MTCLVEDTRQTVSDREQWLKHKYDAGSETGQYLDPEEAFKANRSALDQQFHRRLSDRLSFTKWSAALSTLLALSKLDMRAEIFDLLAKRWASDTMFISSDHDLMNHPACKGIVSMGDFAVPLILRKLQDGSTQNWAGVLSIITGENPVASADRGIHQKINEAWIRWGQARRLI